MICPIPFQNPDLGAGSYLRPSLAAFTTILSHRDPSWAILLVSLVSAVSAIVSRAGQNYAQRKSKCQFSDERNNEIPHFQPQGLVAECASQVHHVQTTNFASIQRATCLLRTYSTWLYRRSVGIPQHLNMFQVVDGWFSGRDFDFFRTYADHG